MVGRLILIFTLYCAAFSTHALDPYATPELDTLKKQFISEINQSDQVIRDPVASTYLNQLGRRLTDAVHMPAATFFIVNANEINAFAGPGGYIGVNAPLILATDSEDELAAVMAHELAHVHLHHLYDMMEDEKMMRLPTTASMLAAMALGMVNPMLGSGAMAATLSGAAQHSLNYTRAHEKEADRIGIQTLAKAGFNTHAMAQFFDKMHQETRYSSADALPAILRSHPLDEERIAEAEDRATRFPAAASHQPLQYALFKTYLHYKTTNDPRMLLDYYSKPTRPQAIENRYGLALAHLSINQFKEAQTLLLPLIDQVPDQPFLAITTAQVELGLHEFTKAIDLLLHLQHSQHHLYATLLALSDAYLQSGQTSLAAELLTKGFRKYPNDLLLCHTLAHAESKNHRPAYAYFIEASCDQLVGQPKRALQRLQVAKTLAKSDAYLQARVLATIDAIKRSE